MAGRQLHCPAPPPGQLVPYGSNETGSGELMELPQYSQDVDGMGDHFGRPDEEMQEMAFRVVTQNGGMFNVREVLSPMVEGLQRHIFALDGRMTALNRVGQTAEQCFALYDQRLASIEEDYKTLWRELEKTFSGVKKCMEAQGEQYTHGDRVLHDQFVGVSDHISMVETKLCIRMSGINDALEQAATERGSLGRKYARLQTGLDQQKNAIGKWEDSFDRLEHRLEKTLADLAGVESVFAELRQTDEKNLDWVIGQISDLSRNIQQLRENPPVKTSAILPSQLDELQSQLDLLRDQWGAKEGEMRREIRDISNGGGVRMSTFEERLRKIENTKAPLIFNKRSIWYPVWRVGWPK